MPETKTIISVQIRQAAIDRFSVEYKIRGNDWSPIHEVRSLETAEIYRDGVCDGLEIAKKLLTSVKFVGVAQDQNRG